MHRYSFLYCFTIFFIVGVIAPCTAASDFCVKLDIINKHDIPNFKILLISPSFCYVSVPDSTGRFIFPLEYVDDLECCWVIDESSKYDVTYVHKSTITNNITSRSVYININSRIDKPIFIPVLESGYKIKILWDEDKRFDDIIELDPQQYVLMFSSLPFKWSHHYTITGSNTIVLNVDYKQVAANVKGHIYIFIKVKGYLPRVIVAKEIDFSRKNKIFKVDEDYKFLKLGAYVDKRLRNSVIYEDTIDLVNTLIWDDQEPFDFTTYCDMRTGRGELIKQHTLKQSMIALSRELLVENSTILWKNISSSMNRKILNVDSIKCYVDRWEQSPNSFSLESPKNRAYLGLKRDQYLIWQNNGDPDPPDYSVHKYHIKLWTEEITRGRTDTIMTYDTVVERNAILDINGKVKFPAHKIDASFRDNIKGKECYWQVDAYDSVGNRTPCSDTYSFYVPVEPVEPEAPIARLRDDDLTVSERSFPDKIRYEYHHRSKNPNYNAFLSTIRNEDNFDDYSQVVLNTDIISTNTYITELGIMLPSPTYLYSVIDSDYGAKRNFGFGIRILPIYLIKKSGYLRASLLLPSITTMIWGHGIKDRTNGFVESSLGLNLDFDDDGSISGSFIPYYTTPYEDSNNEIVNFKASGWALGVELLFFKRLVSEFKVPLINIEIDTRRFLIRYGYSEITNTDDIKIREHIIGLGYTP